MGHEFIPTLIQTITWDTLRWESLRCAMSDDIIRLVHANDLEALKKIIKDDYEYGDDFEQGLKDFVADIQGATGAVAIKNKTYQHIILAFLDHSR